MADDLLAAAIDRLIVEIIDDEAHRCIAYSEGQACCIDPRRAGEPGYGGEAQPKLTSQLVALFESWRDLGK